MPSVLAFSGSAREGSFNQKLVTQAAWAMEEAGCQVTLVSLRDYPMPLFGQDLESREGMPSKAQEFKELLLSHEGFLIASPEYNSSFSPLLKNALDWASRAHTLEEPPLQAFRGKSAALLSASPGKLGGLRGLVGLRMLLENIQVMVLPRQITIPLAAEAFDEEGALRDKREHDGVRRLCFEFASLLEKLHPSR